MTAAEDRCGIQLEAEHDAALSEPPIRLTPLDVITDENCVAFVDPNDCERAIAARKTSAVTLEEAR